MSVFYGKLKKPAVIDNWDFSCTSYAYSPIHGFGGLVFEPENQVDVVVGVLGKNVARKLRRLAHHGLHVFHGNWKGKNESDREKIIC